MENVPHYLRDEISLAEIHLILVTGTRPVWFQKTEDDFPWGCGTLFIAQWGEHQFAITAKHVIENLGAKYQHLRISFPGFNIALPVKGTSTFSIPLHEFREEIEDIVVYQIDKDFDSQGHHLVWEAWRMTEMWMPATMLKKGQQIFAVGFPVNVDRFNYDQDTFYAPPLVAIGMLSEQSIGEGIYTIDCAEFEKETDLNGFSGGPVFARFEGIFFYVGMVTRAGAIARKIHFIDASFITFVLNEMSKKL